MYYAIVYTVAHLYLHGNKYSTCNVHVHCTTIKYTCVIRDMYMYMYTLCMYVYINQNSSLNSGSTWCAT